MRGELSDLLEQVIQQAEAAGATAADAVGVENTEGTVRVRLGEVEQIQRSRERRVGLRVFVGQRQAMTASGDLRPETLSRLVKDTVEIAGLTAEDPNAGLPDASACGATHTDRPDLMDELADGFDLERGAEWARAAEGAAMGADDRITNSEGAQFGFSSVRRAYAASGGVSGSYRSSYFSGYVVPIAVADGGMERDYHYSQRRHYTELESPEAIGAIAAARTVRRLGARKVKTCQVPVVFDNRTASQVLGYVASALSGYGIYRGASFLRDRLGEVIASKYVHVTDDALLHAGMATKPYDGEGLATRTQTIIDRGRLQTYLLDTYSGRKLGLASTASAARSVGDAPTVGATNFHLEAGDGSPEDLVGDVQNGFYITELIGFGVNTTTGDYSQGAAGLWIQNGKLTHAVSEVTIAGQLLDMLKAIDGVANDLERHRSVSAPTFRIAQMTVAGE